MFSLPLETLVDACFPVVLISLQALAIGYSHGTVCIVDIEDKEIIDQYDFAYETSEEFYTANNYGIPCITWAVKAGTLESAVEYNVYVSIVIKTKYLD